MSIFFTLRLPGHRGGAGHSASIRRRQAGVRRVRRVRDAAIALSSAVTHACRLQRPRITQDALRGPQPCSVERESKRDEIVRSPGRTIKKKMSGNHELRQEKEQEKLTFSTRKCTSTSAMRYERMRQEGPRGTITPWHAAADGVDTDGSSVSDVTLAASANSVRPAQGHMCSESCVPGCGAKRRNAGKGRHRHAEPRGATWCAERDA